MGKRDKKKKEEPLLINILFKQLKNSGNFETVEAGSFGDGSGSWIECYSKIGPNKNGKRYSKVLSFTGDGTEIEDIQIYEERMEWADDQKKIE